MPTVDNAKDRKRVAQAILGGPLIHHIDNDIDSYDRAQCVLIYYLGIDGSDIGVYFRLYHVDDAAEIGGSRAHTSVLYSEMSEQNVSCTMMVELDAGDTIKIQGKKSSDAATVKTLPDACRLTIIRR